MTKPDEVLEAMTPTLEERANDIAAFSLFPLDEVRAKCLEHLRAVEGAAYLRGHLAGIQDRDETNEELVKAKDSVIGELDAEIAQLKAASKSVEQAATKAAYERAALAVDAMRDPTIGFVWNATLREAAHTIRALADGGSDG